MSLALGKKLNLCVTLLAGLFGLGGTGLGGYITYKTQSNLLEKQFETEKKKFIVFEYPKIKNKLRHSLHTFIETSNSLAYHIQVKNLSRCNGSDSISKFKEDYYELIWAFETLYWFVGVYAHYTIDSKIKNLSGLVEELLLEEGVVNGSTNMIIPFNKYCAQLRTHYDKLIPIIDKILHKKLQPS